MSNQLKATSLDVILSFIDRNNIELRIDDTPSRDKIERIKQSIRRKKQLFYKTIEHYSKKQEQNVGN
jgi:hypothetical protein